ncbi:hypothetical protein HanPSC8_Chr17g0787511 [Helianthus annuus]|nr:hypothetical protein HanPSC8_Chr17g0787511 [Helianthus annuus]
MKVLKTTDNRYNDNVSNVHQYITYPSSCYALFKFPFCFNGPSACKNLHK